MRYQRWPRWNEITGPYREASTRQINPAQGPGMLGNPIRHTLGRDVAGLHVKGREDTARIGSCLDPPRERWKVCVHLAGRHRLVLCNLPIVDKDADRQLGAVFDVEWWFEVYRPLAGRQEQRSRQQPRPTPEQTHRVSLSCGERRPPRTISAQTLAMDPLISRRQLVSGGGGSGHTSQFVCDAQVPLTLATRRPTLVVCVGVA